MSESTGTVYCIDSSSLIYCRQHYPIDVFPGVWERVDALITSDRLIAHEEVWLEFNRGTNFLNEWAVTRRAQLAVAAEADQIGLIQQIARDFPQAIYTTIGEHRADPWVVALAQTRSCCVVSQERGESRPYPKIPQMCERYGVDHMRIFDVMRAEGWLFD